MTDKNGLDKAKPLPKSKASGEPYRKVKITMWDDPKFRALSPLPPSGQSLFIYLLTGPFTGIIPGLYKAGRAAMAEELGWEVEAFDLALGEVIGLGMAKADLQARVFWLPNAVKHNPPASINVVKSWARSYELLPNCQLKFEAFDALKAACYAVSEAMGMAFDKAFALPKDMPKPLTSGIQIAVSSKQLLTPSLNAGEGADPQGWPKGQQPPSELPRYLDGVDEPIGKFAMTASWLPSRDFRQRAALWGVTLPEPDYLPTELAEFTTYWGAEMKVFTQVQWEQKFARHIPVARANNQKSIAARGNENASVHSGSASRAVQQVRDARARKERDGGSSGGRHGMAPVGSHGGNLLEPLDPEERGGTLRYVDSSDRFDD